MDKYKTAFGDVVDLDNPIIYEGEYNSKYYQGNTEELYKKCLYEIGYTLYYMQYCHPDIDFGAQVKCINRLCKKFAKQNRKYRFKNTSDNRMWFKKFLFKFLDEIENFC